MTGYDYGWKMNMRTKLKSFVLTALLFTLLSLVNGHAQSSNNTQALSALEGRWFLVPVLDSDTATGHIPELQFDTKQARLSGNTGCNRMSGSFLATDSTLQISDKLITTRMACIGYNENTFLQNLLRVDSYKFNKGWLILCSKGLEVSRWSREKPIPKKTGKA
jgi:heat shock protein HslJ